MKPPDVRIRTCVRATLSPRVAPVCARWVSFLQRTAHQGEVVIQSHGVRLFARTGGWGGLPLFRNMFAYRAFFPSCSLQGIISVDIRFSFNIN